MQSVCPVEAPIVGFLLAPCRLDWTVMSDTSSTVDFPETLSEGGTSDSVGNDIRLLGRLLGDAIRHTEGDRVYELVERVRRLAVDARRSGVSAVDDIRDVLALHPLDEQILVLRALDWLSLLANTAEDVHLERQRRRRRS